MTFAPGAGHALVAAAAALLAGVWWAALRWMKRMRLRRVRLLMIAIADAAEDPFGDEVPPSHRDFLRMMLAGERPVGPTEEAPRLRNTRTVEGALARRLIAARIGAVPAPAVLRLRVTERGRPSEIHVLRPSGNPAFDAAVAQAARRARFHPARVFTRPVQVWVEIPVTFGKRS